MYYLDWNIFEHKRIVLISVVYLFYKNSEMDFFPTANFGATAGLAANVIESGLNFDDLLLRGIAGILAENPSPTPETLFKLPPFPPLSCNHTPYGLEKKCSYRHTHLSVYAPP